jgi:cbb3-type cytochrome oxidase cytochrome c subunit
MNLIELEAVLVEVIQANELVVYVLVCSLFLVSWCVLKLVKPGFYMFEDTIQNARKIKEMETYVYVEITGTRWILSHQ